ncbi:hypothetical protein LOTGIDRAFT_169122 [Lottia gigantea]|uniref:Uncharacterized protein n=1 Tax=Lottia gigantea TaxID=225164 RepID=V3ZRY2_LOTGI|nr:hypothetical protein LOTGIDRAFT_169122 [Lottia gigantea]ESO83646.1 hypothetical protein LOTGIDRAFT_169122 [Lottia gigantea]
MCHGRTKELGHGEGSDNTKVSRFRRAPKRILDHSCDEFDCSQKKRASDEEFSCKVGMHKECKAVNRMINDSLREETYGNYAKLTHIDIFNKEDHTIYPYSYRALNYSITLPHEDEGGLKAKMIMTLFNSEVDLYYSKHEICRVFDFSSSKLTENDLKHPRVINYPCMFGLDEISMTDYKLNITVIPYLASLLYYLQIYSYDPKYSCPVNNGISVLNVQRKLHVVFQSYPNTLHYNLTLYKDSKALQNLELAQNKNQHEFKLEDGGLYTVGIKPIIMDKYCNETLTKSVIWKVEVKHIEDKKQGYINLVSIVLPVGIIIITIIAGVVILIKRHREQQMERSDDESAASFLQNQQNSDETSIPYRMIKKWKK